MKKWKNLEQKARQIYETNLDEMLKHPHEAVVFDTISGNYVFGKTITEALKKYMGLGYTKGKAVVMQLDEKARLTYAGRMMELAA